MAARPPRLNRLLSRTVPVLATLMLLLAALFLVSDVEQESAEFSRLYYWVFGFTALALLLLVISIVQRILQLVRRVRAGVPGARLSARMVRSFLVLALPPAFIVYLFSLEFLNETIDGWFDVQVESALEDALSIGRQFMDTRTLEVRNQMLRLVEDLDGLNATDLEDELWRRVSASGPVELSVFDNSGRMRTMANINPTAFTADSPGQYALQQAARSGEFAAAEPFGEDGRLIRVLTALPPGNPLGGNLYLQAIYPLPEEFAGLAANIETEYNRYQRASYLRQSLKQSFILILTLVLMITVLLAILAAILAARRLVRPIGEMASATRSVAAGDFSQEITVEGRDELAQLSESFNQMTAQLKVTREALEHSRQHALRQKEYLEAVMGRLSAGVMTFDGEQQLVSCNQAGATILGIDMNLHSGQKLAQLGQRLPLLAPLAERLIHAYSASRETWREEIRLPAADHALVLLCSGSRLPAASGETSGLVVVFDDASVLNQAQRDAAWTEVARRLAHEVKNPLTPIRLSAERLAMKLGDQLGDDEQRILERSTQTIINQVDALKSLVNAFGDYAREPALSLAPVALDPLVREVAESYRDPHQPVLLELELDTAGSRVWADGGRLRQLLHNLLSNAMAAVQGGDDPQVAVTTSELPAADGNAAQARMLVRDNGPGLNDDIASQPFEPYRTTKPGGTGLGLAICRKIVQEHNGQIRIGNHPDGGCEVEVLLPLADPEGTQVLR